MFTSGATEAANLALTPHLQTGRDETPFDVLLVGAGEHPAALAGHRFAPEQVETVALTGEGALSLGALGEALARHKGKRVMLALQAANNETGVLQPVAEAATLVHAARRPARLRRDPGGRRRIETTFTTTGADILLFSSHKLGGPNGVGALVFARGDIHIILPLLRGGGQECGRRAGTQNVAAIAGLRRR